MARGEDRQLHTRLVEKCASRDEPGVRSNVGKGGEGGVNLVA